MRETPWLLLPVKSLRCGKRRLEPALSNADRLRLNEFFLRRMIAVAAEFPGPERTVIVSDATDSLRLAEELGAPAIRTERQDLNGALADGCAELYRRGARQIMILPVDLPLVQSSDLREIGAFGERHPIVICPDRNAFGTNALYLAKEFPLQFKFGDDSYRQHEAEARRLGVAPLLHYNTRIAKDVDLPTDLAVLDELASLNGRSALSHP
ncbi:MAG TPA: 2-phospho-L-lactate guanylyltransferase [Pseudolabrys sp.]|jgi:2-phospho-L-lactate guanylyltransferase